MLLTWVNLTAVSQSMLLSAECTSSYDTVILNFWKGALHTLAGNISYIWPVSFSFCSSLIMVCVCVCVHAHVSEWERERERENCCITFLCPFFSNWTLQCGAFLTKQRCQHSYHLLKLFDNLLSCSVPLLLCGWSQQFLNLFPFRYFPVWKTQNLLLILAYNVSGEGNGMFLVKNVVMENTEWGDALLWCDFHELDLNCKIHWRYNPLWVCILEPSSGAIASSRTRFLDRIVKYFHKTSLTDVSELLNTMSDCTNLVSDMKDYAFENCSQQYE